MSRINDPRIIDEFVAESLEHLNQIEPDLLALEKGGKDAPMEAINRVFRAAHSIKGASGFHGFDAITELSHTMEEVLNLFRKGKIAPDPENTDALLAGMDKLRAMLDAPATSDKIPWEIELSKLNRILDDYRSSSKNAKEVPEDPQQPRNSIDRSTSDEKCHGPTPCQEVREPEAACHAGEDSRSDPHGKSDPIHDAGAMVKVGLPEPLPAGDICFKLERQTIDSVAANMEIYLAWLDSKTDLAGKNRTLQDLLEPIGTYGRYLASTIEGRDLIPAQLSTEIPHIDLVLFASIMEPELMGHALDIVAGQITLVPRDKIETIARKPQGRPCDIAPDESPAVHNTPQQPTPSSAAKRQDTIRINVALIDKLMNLAGELVLGRNQLRQLLEDYLYKDPKLRPVFQHVDVVTTEMQEGIMMMRLQPASKLFDRFPRLVRDLCRQLNKEAELITEGAEVELDKSILESLADPMTHLIRNCVDHAIESPEHRKKLGKPVSGRIGIKAIQEGGQVIITVEDDGAGIDVDKIADKALSLGLIAPGDVECLPRSEKLNLIFSPGLSTAGAVTEVSGRGVGMDVVKTNIESIGGHVDVESRKGLGTTISIRLPLTLAIIPSLIVGTGKLRFAIPQVKVRELVCVPVKDASRKIKKFGNTYILRLRDRLLPVVSLAKVLNMEKTWIHPETGHEATERRRPWADPSHPDATAKADHYASQACPGENNVFPADRRAQPQKDINIAVLRVGPYIMGLVVDELFDTQEIVVKPLSNHVKDSQCFAGATIMEDGSVAMILDPAGIADFVHLRFSEIRTEEQRRNLEDQQNSNTAVANEQSYLLFTNAPEECFALPLQNIARISMTDPRSVQRVGDRDFITHRGQGLPLLYLDRILPVQPSQRNPLDKSPSDRSKDELYFIIPKNKKTSVGIVASKILDTFDGKVAIHKDIVTPQGFTGSAMINGRLTMFLDVDAIMDLYEKRGQIPGQGAMGA